MKQLLAWAGSADSTITSEAVMAMAEKFNTGQEVCLQIPSARGVMQVKEGTSGVMRVPWPLSAFKAKQSSRCKARSPSRPKSRSRWGQFGHWSRQHRRLVGSTPPGNGESHLAG